ncbi:hypothetical protein [Hymenobacter sp. PAMC 26628]|uniref:hypothetical protein n=1 Tax=Hymenobacter sp. PAMC 26628 TaxID=1484118 RepID=UPI00077014DC|nr:hypothetical protein [Hymenobacter sp. PAMC 26628]AMJ67391.1 hypothetical protein AXW84_19655 [Hymenobacter sp. PAMC 26628]
MSDLHNPLFDSEKEFLEQKKLEYERALRGDVEQIKEKTVQVGKVALAGAGLAGSVWLITKLFSSKPKPRRFANESGPVAPSKDKKGKKGPPDPNTPKSAAASAAVFQEVMSFDAAPAGRAAQPVAHEPDPFEPQPAALASKAVASRPAPAPKKAAPAKPAKESWLKSEAAGTLGALAKAAWQSDVARGLISQAAAVGVAALVGHKAVKSAVEDAQAPKNPDLAARADAAAAGAGAAGPFSPAQPSTPDAPRQHPA